MTYPSNWTDIAIAIKDDAAWRCENCDHPDDWPSGHVLTVHHLDMDPSNCHPDNLVALCQRCHLSIQAKYRVGQLTLPVIPPPRWMITRQLTNP